MQRASQTSIKFHFLIRPFFFPHRSYLKQFLASQLQKEGKTIDNISYVFCDDAYLLQINQDYLQHDTYTDIITFELSPPNQPLLADIYISVERVKQNAQEFGSAFRQELLRVIFHGALHLIGYKDKSPAQSERMRKQEEFWLSAFNVPRGIKP